MSLPAGASPPTAEARASALVEGGEDDYGSAELLQFGREVLGGAVDVEVRAELLGERAFVGSAGDSDGAVAAFCGVLHAEMTEASDAEDGDEVAGARSAVAEAVVGGDAGAHEWGGVHVGEIVWDEREGVGGGDDVVGIAAVEADAGDLAILAENEIAAAAGRTVVAVASVPTEADALAYFEERNIGADRVDDTGDFMAGYAGVLNAGPIAELGERIAVANAAGLHANADVAGAGLGEFFFYKLKRAAGGGDLHGTTSDCGH